MQCKDKPFMGEGFKASHYELFSLKKNQPCSSVVIRVLGSAFCFKRTDSALSQPSECFTRVVTSLCAVFSEEDHDTWTICHHLKPTWVVGLPLCVKWKIYSLAKSFICLNAIQPAWISSKCLPSAFDLTLAGFQGRYILLFRLIISSTQRFLAVPGLLCPLFISGTSWVPNFLSFMNLTSLYPSHCVQQILTCGAYLVCMKLTPRRQHFSKLQRTIWRHHNLPEGNYFWVCIHCRRVLWVFSNLWKHRNWQIISQQWWL